jgi:predicted transcriptional regulator YdeE
VIITAVNRERFYVVGLRISNVMEGLEGDILRARQELNRRIDEIDRVKMQTITYGISPPNYKGNTGIVDFYVCVEVEPLLRLPHGMVNLTVDPQMYAVASYQGPMNRKVEAYDATSRWLADSGYTYATALYFERYDERTNMADDSSADNAFDAYSPIRSIG